MRIFYFTSCYSDWYANIKVTVYIFESDILVAWQGIFKVNKEIMSDDLNDMFDC